MVTHKSLEGAGKSMSLKGKAHKSHEDEGGVGLDSDSNLGEQAEEEWEDMEDESEDGDKGSQTGKKEAKTGRKPHRKTSNFTSVMKKMVDYTTIHVLRPTVGNMYKLVVEGLTSEEAKKRTLQWFPHAYHTQVSTAKGKGHFQHDFLQDAMFKAYFTGLSPVGIIYKKWFQHMPLPAIGLIKWIIQQHETGRYVPIKMTFQALQEYYNKTMDLLKAFETRKQGPHCAVVEWAGHLVVQEEILPVDKVLHEDDFAKDMPTTEELKMVA
ncbi:hypothetical protein FRC11_007285 [Ceratobasidium sp. 423]|nr:hypothetical protein FRC11_007285 [Ceratobasidium sp. 423]